MSTTHATHAIRHIRITPIAFRDPPLLNAAGIHEPWALRSIIEIETASGLVGINESYGDQPMLDALAKAAPALVGLSPWALNEMEVRVAALVAPPALTASEFLGQQVSLAPGTHVSKTVAKVVSAFEVAMLDLQGQMAGAPIVDLLGGAARDSVPFSAYLFYKYAEHIDRPYGPDSSSDAWGEALAPQQLVEQARRMIAQYGFQSIKLKAGALPPEQEAAGILALADAFPGTPLRIDPNGNWTVETSLKIVQQLQGVLEYYEDPAPGLDGMAAVARECDVPLATNMVVTDFAEFRRNADMGCPVKIVLSDHHYWGGLRATQRLSTLCRTFDLGLSMHSNSHLGISLVAMTHLCASVPLLTYACDTHYPWQDEEVVEGGRLQFEQGSLRVPTAPGLGVRLDREALARLHDNYLHCGIRNRDDLGQMRKYDPAFTGHQPRF
ncbi:glucarate dehydratase family protein [Delftia acidovorans]|uniref:glucarate dehydratase family protein n=1 Tax=Delftia acidovorans TaxID=80866 RepID=UPI00286F47A4|nr:glucarate dehydratase family protein [Delftia acidovorans]